MPTTRPRHMITETDEIARALDAAAERWPDARDNRAELLRRLVTEAGSAADGEREADRDRRRDAVARIAGRYTGMYRRDEARLLREEWPE